jgi:hypothetical protein
MVMLPFTTDEDADIKEAERIIAEELEIDFGAIGGKGIKTFSGVFLRGFEIGYTQAKRLSKKYQSFYKEDTNFHVVEGKKVYWMLGDDVDAELKDKLSKFDQYLGMEDLNNATKLVNLGHIIGFFDWGIQMPSISGFSQEHGKFSSVNKETKK